ncbi:MAG: hypothetical protein ABEJ58_07155 [Halodesulfurarchaeum sp.]
MEYRPGHIWVTAVVDRVRARFVSNFVLASLLSVGAIPLVLTGVFFALTAGDLTGKFVVGQGLATVVAVFGPIGIWYYDRRVFPDFYDQMTDIVEEGAALSSIVSEYDRRFRENFWYVAIPWMALIVSVVVLNRDFFAAYGVSGLGDPAFLVYLGFALWWGLITGIGFHGALITVRCIRAVGTLRMQIDPLHPDGLGGLSSIGYFAIWTTMLISVGSLTLPLAFLIAARGNFRSIVYLAVGLYVLLIALSFVYPTVYVNRRAQSIREEILEEKRSKIRTLQQELGEPISGDSADIDDLATQYHIQTIREDFKDYRSVSLYPMTVGILSRLLSSVFLPLAFVFLEVYISGSF